MYDIGDVLFHPVTLIGGVIVLIGIYAYACVQEEREWDKFKSEHHCKVVAHISGSSTVGVGVGGNGQVTAVPVYIPGKTGWQCDDGMTYFR